MAREHITLGGTPAGEDCAQVSAEDYHARVHKEMRAWINQLKRAFPDPPAGASFGTKAFSHDFGTYHEVVVWYDPDDEAAVEYAFRVDEYLPPTWDDAARRELEGG